MNKNNEEIDRFNLPLRRSLDKDFYEDLEELLGFYLNFIKKQYPEIESTIASNNKMLLNVISNYFLGLSHQAYQQFEELINCIWKDHPRVFEKIGGLANEDTFIMYRMRVVNQDTCYTRKELSHLPYSLKEQASACRYSISGFPCLYMNTELKGCYSEINANYKKGSAKYLVACGIKYNRDPENSSIDSISVLDLSQNFENCLNLEKYEQRGYLLWYPIIAASSFIRRDRTESVASEYIVPQMLLQYIRLLAENKKSTLWGIRYLSCSSAAAAERGINYVFPVCNYSRSQPYCETLKEAFLFSTPVCFENNSPPISSKEEYNLFWENKKEKFKNVNYRSI